MMDFQMDLVLVFCVSAIIMFVVSVGILMLIVYSRKAKPECRQSQGQASDIIYVPTTVTNDLKADTNAPAELVKPLLIGFEKVEKMNNLYPTKELKELTPLTEE